MCSRRVDHSSTNRLGLTGRSPVAAAGATLGGAPPPCLPRPRSLHPEALPQTHRPPLALRGGAARGTAARASPRGRPPPPLTHRPPLLVLGCLARRPAQHTAGGRCQSHGAGEWPARALRLCAACGRARGACSCNTQHARSERGCGVHGSRRGGQRRHVRSRLVRGAAAHEVATQQAASLHKSYRPGYHCVGLRATRSCWILVAGTSHTSVGASRQAAQGETA